MREHPDHHDAELMLRLYDLRREPKLREARDWFILQFRADSADDYLQRYLFGSKESEFVRMVISYWDMAGSIVNHGLIKEEFFFENTSEFWAVWQKVKGVTPALREKFKDPHLWENLQTLAEKYEKWVTARSPGALEMRRERFKHLIARK